MGTVNLINIVNCLKKEAKEELPYYPKTEYKNISNLYAAIYDNGSFATSCSTSILTNANECFMLISGLNCYGAYSHILYYINEDGIPHKEGFIDGRWSILTQNIKFGSNPYYYADVLFLKIDNCEIARSEELNNETCEKAFRDIVGKFLAIRHCKTTDEAKLTIKVLEMETEMHNNKNMSDFIKAYLTEESKKYKHILDDLKELLETK